jgi:hypothetical protein
MVAGEPQNASASAQAALVHFTVMAVSSDVEPVLGLLFIVQALIEVEVGRGYLSIGRRRNNP